MSAIEWAGQVGYAFTVTVKDPLAGFATLATGLSVTEYAPGFYRCSTGSLTGIVYIEATAGVAKTIGYANLSKPGPDGYSDVVDTLEDAGVPPTDLTDYRSLYAGSWRHLPNVHDAGFEFSPQRRFAGTAPTAPTSGVKIRKANPSQKQMIDASAAGVGIDGTDQAITLWAYTLSASYAFEPKPKDKIIVLSSIGIELERWIIESVKRAMFGAQFICYCKASPLNSSEDAVV